MVLATVWRWLRRWRTHQGSPCQSIPAELWAQTLAQCPFLSNLTETELTRLRELSALFLKDKEFHGAQGLIVTDAMALTIAAQACLPVLHQGAGAEPLRWYDDFVGIVLHPQEVLAPRVITDDVGVVHEYQEAVVGEAMPGGPVMLSWHDVAAANAETGYNLVIHEFIHKLDLRDGQADGCPPLNAGFGGLRSARAARAHWLSVLHEAYVAFRDQVIRAERFGGTQTWLDPYGASAVDEFFAVASEAYFVNRSRFGQEFPALLALFDAWYRPGL